MSVSARPDWAPSSLLISARVIMAAINIQGRLSLANFCFFAGTLLLLLLLLLLLPCCRIGRQLLLAHTDKRGQRAEHGWGR